VSFLPCPPPRPKLESLAQPQHGVRGRTSPSRGAARGCSSSLTRPLHLFHHILTQLLMRWARCPGHAQPHPCLLCDGGASSDVVRCGQPLESHLLAARSLNRTGSKWCFFTPVKRRQVSRTSNPASFVAWRNWSRVQYVCLHLC